MTMSRLSTGLLSWLLLFLLLTLVFVLSWMPVYPYSDFWGHAAVGRWCVEHAAVPRHALFVWTAPDHPWVDHEWLSQIVFYGLARLGGEDERAAQVALLFTGCMACLPFLVVWFLWRSRVTPGILAVLAFYLALEVSRARFLPRPELFTAVAVALLLVLLTNWRRGEITRRRLVLTGVGLVVLFVVWVNLHGAFLVGVLLLVATVACDMVQYRDRRAVQLAWLGLLGCCSTLANPYGPAICSVVWSVRSETFSYIPEWQPLWSLPGWPWLHLGEHALLLVLAGLGWALNPSRRLAQLAWAVLGSALFACAVRNTSLSALIDLLIMADNARFLDVGGYARALIRRLHPGKERPLPVLPGLLLGVAVAFWLGLQIGCRWIDIQDFAFPVSPARFHQGAVHFMKIHEEREAGFCDCDCSSYLMWRWAGNPHLYIDMMNAYPDSVTADYRDLTKVTPRGKEILTREGITWVLLTTLRPPGTHSLAPLATFLDGSPDWLRVYADADGILWVRRTRANEVRYAEATSRVLKVDFTVIEAQVGSRFPLP